MSWPSRGVGVENGFHMSSMSISDAHLGGAGMGRVEMYLQGRQKEYPHYSTTGSGFPN